MYLKLLGKYIVYVVYFLGVGLVSSGIVLMPFNVGRYLTILLTGLGLFIVGSIINEFLIDKKALSFRNIISLVFLSLTLAIGIGMISGGISHFKESPVYVSYLIPLGVVISFISFTLNNGYLKGHKKKVLFTILIIVGFILHVALSSFANYYVTKNDLQPGGDIFNHGVSEKKIH